MSSQRPIARTAAPALRLALAVSMMAMGATRLTAQTLHVNHEWDECAIVFDPVLTQGAFHQFVSELALVTYFRPLVSARPLGKGKIEFALLNQGTRIDDRDPAWNDTFSHPDSSHWLFEGDALHIPGLMLRVGVTDRIDVGAYLTKNLNANYGIAGGQVQYNLLNDMRRNFAAAGRLSVVTLFGPDDVSVSVYGADLFVSKKLSVFAPYAGVSGYLSHGKETTSKVTLDSENVLGVHGTMGVAANVSFLRLGAEYNVGKVSGYSFKIGYGTR
jgi:hypothetical protein